MFTDCPVIGWQDQPFLPVYLEVHQNRKSMEHVRQWELLIQRFGARQYVEEYRFVNLDQLSLHEAYETFFQGLEQIFDHLQQLFETGDYTQLRLEAVSMHDCLYSPTINLSNRNTKKCLDWVSTLLQSKKELCFDQTFHLTIITVKAIGGGVCRALQSLPHSKISSKKKQHYLIDSNNSNNNLCFAGSLTALTAVRDLTDAELLSRAKELHDKLGWSLHRKVTLSDIPLCEDLLHANTCDITVSEGKKGWGIFKPNSSLKYLKTCFLLFHDEHYYGVRDIRKISAVRNFCELCQTLYNHRYGSVSVSL